VFNVLGNENATETKPGAAKPIGRRGAKLAALAAGATLIFGIGTAGAVESPEPGGVEPLASAAKRSAAAKPGASGIDAVSDGVDDGVDGVRERVREATKPKRPKFPSPESVGVATATLEAIAACESGGDPTIVDASGTYRGKYQFDMGTWASVGGKGDPAAAPEAEQDYRAALLMSRSGSSPWPVCG